MEQFQNEKMTQKIHSSDGIAFWKCLLLTTLLLGSSMAQSDLNLSPTNRAMTFISNQVLPPDPGIGSYTSDVVVMSNISGADAFIAVRMKSGDREAVSTSEDGGDSKASTR